MIVALAAVAFTPLGAALFIAQREERKVEQSRLLRDGVTGTTGTAARAVSPRGRRRSSAHAREKGAGCNRRPLNIRHP